MYGCKKDMGQRRCKQITQDDAFNTWEDHTACDLISWPGACFFFVWFFFNIKSLILQQTQRIEAKSNEVSECIEYIVLSILDDRYYANYIGYRKDGTIINQYKTPT